MKKTFLILLLLAGTALFGNVIFIKAPTVAGGGTTITDNFNRADSELSVSPSAEGWSWVNAITNTLSIATNELKNSGSNQTAEYYADSSLGGPDMEVEVTLTNEFLTSTSDLKLGARWTDTDNNYHFKRSHNTNDFRLYRRVSGTNTQIGSAYAADPTPPYTVKIVVDGDQISGYVNGVLRCGPVTDTSITTGNYSAIRLFSNGASLLTVDDFTASSL